MANEVALTVLGLGHEVDGKFVRVDVQPGDSVPNWVSADDLRRLRENGAVGIPVEVSSSPSHQEELASKDKEIEELKALLAAATVQAPKDK